MHKFLARMLQYGKRCTYAQKLISVQAGVDLAAAAEAAEAAAEAAESAAEAAAAAEAKADAAMAALLEEEEKESAQKAAKKATNKRKKQQAKQEAKVRKILIGIQFRLEIVGWGDRIGRRDALLEHGDGKYKSEGSGLPWLCVLHLCTPYIP